MPKLVERILLAVIGLDLAALLCVRLDVLPLPAGTAFRFILPLLVLPTLGLWVWFDRRVARGRTWWLRAAWTLYIIAMLLPFAAVLIGGRHMWDAMPVGAIMWLMLWYLTALGVACLAVAAAITYFPVRCYRWLHSEPIPRPENSTGESPTLHSYGDGATPVPHRFWDRLLIRRRSSESVTAGRDNDCRQYAKGAQVVGRREVLGWAAAAAPIYAVGAGVGLGFQQSGKFLVRRVRIAMPRCPDRLKGLTITHISDLHVGRLFRAEHLPAVVEAANRLRSDLVVVTGDLVDHTIDFLPPAADGLAQLEHRHGRFLVAGNHDLMDSPAKFVAEMRRREPGFLRDDLVKLQIGGEKVQIAGLFWSHADRSDGMVIGHDERAFNALMTADPNVFTIGLAHHPHAFDALAAHGVDLTLSGHTHGGQFCLGVPGTDLSISAGSLMFRYIRGQYRQGQSVLFVTTGVGNWFPVRLNAPAEIVQIQLV